MENRQYISYSMDREFGCHTLYEIVSPVPSNMNRGMLKKHMLVEYNLICDSRNKQIVYNVFFGRLMEGHIPIVGRSINLPYCCILNDGNADIERRLSLCILGVIMDFTKSIAKHGVLVIRSDSFLIV